VQLDASDRGGSRSKVPEIAKTGLQVNRGVVPITLDMVVMESLFIATTLALVYVAARLTFEIEAIEAEDPAV